MAATQKKAAPGVRKSGSIGNVSHTMAATQSRTASDRMKSGPIDNAPNTVAATQKKAEPAAAVMKSGPIDNASYSCSELVEALKSIQKVIRCSTCHKSLSSVRLCVSGHAFCYNCKRRCSHYCHICREVILDTKPDILSDLIKVLPRSCNYASKGCDSLILPHDVDHENYCRFRRIFCRIPDCGWKGNAKDLLLHLEKLHGKGIIRTPSQTQILMSFNTDIDKEGLAVVVAFNNIFWQHVRIRQNRMLQFYQYIPMEKPTKKYVVQISFHTQEASYSSTTPVHTDLFDPAQLFEDKETFALPKKTALSFNRFHSGVHYTFKIVQLDM